MEVTTLIKQYIGVEAASRVSQLRTDVEIDPNAVVEHRTDVEEEYDIMFNDNNPSELW